MSWLDQLFRLLPLWEHQLIVFLLVLGRISGLMLTAPLLGGRDVPRQFKALLTFVLALLVAPLQWDTSFPRPANVIDAAVMIGCELAIGGVLGLGVMILFTGLQVAGQTIGQLSGMSLGELFDPTFDDNSHVFSQLMFHITLAVFVAIGGHRLVVAALVDTFAALPPGSGLPGGIAETLTTLTAQSFALGIRAAAPVLTALLLSLVVLAIIGRAVPQLNVLMLGFGLNSLVALAVLALSLSGVAYVFQEELNVTLETLRTALSAGSGQ